MTSFSEKYFRHFDVHPFCPPSDKLNLEFEATCYLEMCRFAKVLQNIPLYCFKMDLCQSFKNSLRNDDCHFPVASTRNTPHHFQKLRFSWNCIKPDQLQTLDWVL